MKSLLTVVALVALTGCAGVRANTDHVSKPKWDGGIVDVDGFSKDQWFAFNILPTLWGGVGFNLNSGGLGLKLFPWNVNADFTDDAADPVEVEAAPAAAPAKK